ncbi:putative adhesin [Massilia sp. W12]|uniref:putative adhesin n=1 Tax=Massilia sp. W12 TaxID=3126507 RepID=UPI0030D36513
MPALASNQTELGSNVYFFESPAPNTADCIIMAHGATVAGNAFIVPANVTILFEADAGQAVVNHQGSIRSRLGLPQAPAIPHRNRYQGGARCPDQILGKALGQHWDDPGQRDGNDYYRFVQQAMTTGHGLGNWAPHFISIRNRKGLFSKEFVWLSEVVRLLRTHKPAVTNIYSYGCRNYDTSGALARRAGNRAYIAT